MLSRWVKLLNMTYIWQSSSWTSECFADSCSLVSLLHDPFSFFLPSEACKGRWCMAGKMSHPVLFNASIVSGCIQSVFGSSPRVSLLGSVDGNSLWIPQCCWNPTWQAGLLFGLLILLCFEVLWRWTSSSAIIVLLVNGVRCPHQIRGPKIRANVPPRGPCWRHRVCHLGAIVVAWAAHGRLGVGRI